jgi:hypothetical protein
MRVFRPFRNRGMAVVAMLLLVLGTAAPALARMTCVMGGPSTLSIGAAEDCMPVDHSHPETTVKATCCEVLQTQPQRTDFVPGGPVAIPLLQAVQVPTLPVVVCLRAGGSVNAAFALRGPPLDRAHRLAAVGAFRI